MKKSYKIVYLIALFLINILSLDGLKASTCDTVCQSTTTKKYFVSGVSDVTGYSWSVSGGLAIVSGQTTDTIVVNFSGVATSGVYTISVRPYNLCDTAAITTFNVFVQTTPTKPNAGADVLVCAGSPFTLTATGTFGAIFNWDRPTLADTTAPSLSVSSASLVDSGLYILTQTINGCVSSKDTVLVNVTPNPGKAVNTTSQLAICETGTKTLSGTPAGGSWSIVSGGGTIAGTTYTPANITANTSVTVRYTIAATGSCAATTSDSTFLVNFIDTAKNTTSTAAICETGTKTLSGTPASGTWSIVSGGGTIAGTTYTPANITSNTSVTVRYTVAANGVCPSTTSDSTFTVNFIDTAKNTTSTAAICETGTKTLSGTPAGGSWSIVSGGGAIAGTIYTPANVTSNTSVTVRYTIAANGVCPSTTSDSTFTVNSIDSAVNTTSTAAICETGTKTLSGTPATGTWSIVSGGGSIAGTTYTPANVSLNTAVVVRYTVAANGVCPSTFADSVFVVNFIDSAKNTTSTAAICETGTKTLSATPASGTWSIVSGGGSIAGTTYTPANITSNTSVTVRYSVAANGVCPATTSDSTFTVNFIDTAKNTTSTAAICETSTKTLSGTPASGTWSIVSGGGSIAGTTYTPANVSSNTSVTVRYTVAANGACSSTFADSVFIVNFIDSAKNTTSTAAICESATKTLSGTPATGVWSIVSGGGSIAGTTYTPANIAVSTPVTVRYTVAANGACSSTTSDSTFIVNPNDPAVNTTNTAAICETSTKALTGTPAGGSWSIVSGGGSITGTTYTPANIAASTSVTVRYTIAAVGSCPSSFSDSTFTVHPAPDAPIANKDTIICAASSLNLVATGVSGATYTWTKPNASTFVGSTLALSSISTADSGRYIVYQTSIFGCQSTANDTVNVNIVTPPVIALDSVFAPTLCNAANATIRIKGLKPNTTYTVSYLNPSNVAISLSLTSNASGMISIIGLPVGTYKDITATTLTGLCPSNKILTTVIKGPPPAGTPIINCK